MKRSNVVLIVGIGAILFFFPQIAYATVESTPLEYWLSTTDPRDLAAIREKEERSQSGHQAIIELAENYPCGITAGGGKL